MADATDLDRLIERVEAGAATVSDFRRVWPDPRKHMGHPLGVAAARAYDASLDAGMNLHQALLPGWHPLVGRNVHHHYWHANVQRLGDDGIIQCEGSTDQPNPGRALLLAVLRAYRTSQEAGE